MNEATDTTTRRGLFGASAAVLLLAAPRAATAAADPSDSSDDQLIADCQAFAKIDDERRAADLAGSEDQEAEANDRAWDAAFLKVNQHRPQTAAGARHRAGVAYRAMLSQIKVGRDESWEEQASDPEWLAMDCLYGLTLKAEGLQDQPSADGRLA